MGYRRRVGVSQRPQSDRGEGTTERGSEAAAHVGKLGEGTGIGRKKGEKGKDRPGVLGTPIRVHRTGGGGHAVLTQKQLDEITQGMRKIKDVLEAGVEVPKKQGGEEQRSEEGTEGGN